MSNTLDVRFAGLQAPVRFVACEELLPSLRQIIPRWAFEARPPEGGVEPVAVVSPAKRGRYTCTTLSSCGRTRTFDAVNTICDLICELSWELLRSGQWLMCLHGAAVEISGRLVIVPNVRRAGKSTLTSCLAARQCRVFSDDFFPVTLDERRCFTGVAMGIAPRLRLPVPREFSDGFRDWVARNSGPANRQYKYLSLPDLPAHGTASPLGAIVFLDRRDTGSTTLSDIDESAAIEALLHQNFARSVHSGTILNMVEALMSAIPAHRLTYSSAESAADFLVDRFGRWPDALPVARSAHDINFREADLAQLEAPTPDLDCRKRYVRARGYSEVSGNGGHYLTDADGLGIHRLNDGALAIWRILEEPARLDEVCDVLSEAFPDVARTTIETDSARVFRRFVETRLIAPPR